MKKFLTVLLVIAVMFTFSFGSAFAAIPDADARLVKQAEAALKAELPETVKKAIAVVIENSANDYITEAAWEAAAADIVETLEGELKDITAGYLTSMAGVDSKWDDYDLAYAVKALYDTLGFDYISIAGCMSADNHPYAVTAAKEQFKINFEKNLAKYDKVDMNLYSQTKPTAENSYYKQAEAAVKLSKETLTDLYFDVYGKLAPLSAWTTVTAIEADENWYEAAMENGDGNISKLTKQYWDGENTLFKGTYAIGSIDTLANLEDQVAVDAAKTAQLKADIAKLVADYLKTNKSQAAKDFAAAYATVGNYLAEEDPNLTKFTWALGLHAVSANGLEDIDTEAYAKNLADAIDEIEALEAYAAKYAAEVDANGVKVRDAEDIQDIVDDAKLSAYEKAFAGSTSDAEYAVSDARKAIVALSLDLDAEYLAFQKEAKKAELASELKYDKLPYYYDLEDELVKAAYEKAYAAIDAAKKDTEFADIEAALDKEVAKILNKTQVQGLFVSKTAMKNELADQNAALTAYLGFKNANLNPYDLGVVKAGTNVVRDYYIAQGVRSAAEMKAMTGVVEAVAATLPTAGDIEAAKKAAEAAVKALPTDADDVVVADKDAIVAAYNLVEAYKDLCDAAGEAYNLAKMDLTVAVDGLEAAYAKQFKLAYVQADKTDKAAMRTIKSEISAVNTELVEEVELTGFASLSTKDVTDALKKIQEAELAAVEKAINAIPVNVTFADEAAVVAAREAYDAYVADWTNVDRTAKTGEYNYNGASYMDGFHMADADNYRELALAEAVLGLNAPEEVDAAYSVEGLKITASSKATKGAITVKWTVEGDTDAVEGYEIWKSTKKNSGFKKAFTATKMSYKNTKDLKKGTRYFYKVRAIAYTAEGEKVKSDWSNKAYRVAK